jgi:hypothetical protein
MLFFNSAKECDGSVKGNVVAQSRGWGAQSKGMWWLSHLGICWLSRLGMWWLSYRGCGGSVEGSVIAHAKGAWRLSHGDVHG